MVDDLWGYPINLEPGPALESWNAMQIAFLGHKQRTADNLANVIGNRPDFAPAQAAKGLFMLLLARSELVPMAREALALARSGGRDDMRERGLGAALSEWLDGRISGAIARTEELIAAYPRDAFLMKLSHAMRFMAGDVRGMRQSLDDVAPHYDESHPAWGYYLGCRAFAFEETGDYDLAQAAGEQGLAVAPDDAWGLHAVAHVHDMTGNARNGLLWLEGREAAWAECNNFRYHVWWHKALMYLDEGDADAALALYDTEIRKDKTDDYRDISNATSLLMRLGLEGHEVGARWDELAELSAARTEDGSLIFADLHYLLGLIGAGNHREAERRLIARIQADAARGAREQDAVAKAPGIAAAIGLSAFGDGAYDRAFTLLGQARADMQSVGGSHAQRDIFERITIDAGLRAGRVCEAEALLEDRRIRRGGAADGFARARRNLIAQMRLSPAAE